MEASNVGGESEEDIDLDLDFGVGFNYLKGVAEDPPTVVETAVTDSEIFPSSATSFSTSPTPSPTTSLGISISNSSETSINELAGVEDGNTFQNENNAASNEPNGSTKKSALRFPNYPNYSLAMILKATHIQLLRISIFISQLRLREAEATFENLFGVLEDLTNLKNEIGFKALFSLLTSDRSLNDWSDDFIAAVYHIISAVLTKNCEIVLKTLISIGKFCLQKVHHKR
jgi:hypothetical protein